MNYWLFQSVVDRYDTRDSSLVKEGESDTWYATRYRAKMKPGDIVFFWLGGIGDERGIYVTGTLASEPYKKAGWDSYGIDVTYKKKLSDPILVAQVKSNKKLSGMLILRAPQATNFLLTEEQGKELVKLCGMEG
ncbi:MAG: EVE domain-containing protein [Deltaproteobacteria bacterium]|nr:EVE domain-containing protein [Deltaproteobacteria bacterium]